MAIDQILQSGIKKIDVINKFRRINARYGIKSVTVRTENGIRFIAIGVKQFLAGSEAKQQITHIATPQENAYIEALHSTVNTEVVERFDFLSYYEAKQTFRKHFQGNNTERKHGQIGRITPLQK
jgi:transposase InsO family protein